jgi:hypothetical protein
MAQPLTVEEENELARAKKLAELRDRARLFREVLGSPHGILVLAAIRKAFQFGDGIPPNITGEDGHTDPLQTHRKLGTYSVIRWIEIQLEWKESDYGNPSGGGA